MRDRAFVAAGKVATERDSAESNSGVTQQGDGRPKWVPVPITFAEHRTEPWDSRYSEVERLARADSTRYEARRHQW